VFLDANQVKDAVRKNLIAPDKISKFKETGISSAIIKSNIFETGMLVVISINTIWLAVDTDYNSAATLMEADLVFIIAENLFCAIFTMEIVLRIVAFRHKSSLFYDAWFVFDSLLVALMILETWIFVLVLAILGGSSASGLVENASILRVARMFRLARMARMARLLRFVPELMILIKGMLSAARSVFFTLCLLFILLYIFAIGMTQLTVDTNVGDQYFSSMGGSMYTLFISGSLLQNVGVICDSLGEEHLIFGAAYLGFVILAALMVMNMLTGVLCEVVSAVAAIEKDQMLINYVKVKMLSVIEKLDEDGNNSVSRTEFENMLREAEAVRALTEVGVDVVGLVDFADVIFEEEEELSFGRFMEIVLELRGSNGATVKDVIELRKLIRNAMADTQFIITRMEKTVEDCVRNVQHFSAESQELANRQTKMFKSRTGECSNQEPGGYAQPGALPRNAWCPGEEPNGHAKFNVKRCSHEESKDSQSEDMPREALLPYIQRGFAELARRLDAMSQEASRHGGDKLIAKDELRPAPECGGVSEDLGDAWWKEETASGRLKLEPIVSLKNGQGKGFSSDTSAVDDMEERHRVPHSQTARMSKKASLPSTTREASGDDFQRIRSRVSRLAKHLTAGLVEVNELQRTLSSGRRSTSQDGEVS